MNLTEGAIRMQRVGRAMVIIALGAFALCVCLAVIYAFLPSFVHAATFFAVLSPVVFTLIWISAMAMAAGAVLWIAGWILEGFAKGAN